MEKANVAEKRQKLDLVALRLSPIFKKYDIRGSSPSQINQDVAMSIGWAFGQYLLKHGDVKEVVIGHDSRQASYEIVPAFAMGLSAHGVSIICQRECPTPVISKLVKDGLVKAGVSITASHNAVDQTGFKLYHDGSQLFDKQIREVSDYLGDPEYIKQVFAAGMTPGENKNVMSINVGAVEDYFHAIASQFNFEGKNPKIMVHSFSHKTEEYLSNLFECTNLVGYKFYTANRDRYVRNCDPGDLDNCLAVIKFIQARQTKNCIGILFDGDFDRVLVVDELGRIVDSSTLAAIFVKGLAKENKSPVVVDVCTNSQVSQVAKAEGLEVEVSKTGAPFVSASAKKVGAMFSGESSGHYTFYDKGHNVDDGIYACMRLIELLTKQQVPLFKLVDQVPPVFSTGVLRLDCAQQLAQEAIQKVEHHFQDRKGVSVDRLDGVLIRFEDCCSVLVRASNTEDKLTVLIQTNTKEELESLITELKNVLLTVFQKEKSCES